MPIVRNMTSPSVSGQEPDDQKRARRRRRHLMIELLLIIWAAISLGKRQHPLHKLLKLVALIVLGFMFYMLHAYGNQQSGNEKLARNVTIGLMTNNAQLVTVRDAPDHHPFPQPVIARAAEQFAPFGKLSSVVETTPWSSSGTHEFDVRFASGARIHEAITLDEHERVVSFSYRVVPRWDY